MSNTDYWEECIAECADTINLALTKEQITALAKAVAVSHENYGMAFYSPPASDRISDIEREWKAKLAKAEQRLETYRHDAETAVKRALGQRSDASVSIDRGGEVIRYDGRFERIQ